jgi:hypothetical protein
MQASGKLTLDLISSAEALTLPGLFLRHCEKTPEAEAYRQYDSAGKRTFRRRAADFRKQWSRREKIGNSILLFSCLWPVATVWR